MTLFQYSWYIVEHLAPNACYLWFCLWEALSEHRKLPPAEPSHVAMHKHTHQRIVSHYQLPPFTACVMSHITPIRLLPTSYLPSNILLFSTSQRLMNCNPSNSHLHSTFQVFFKFRCLFVGLFRYFLNTYISTEFFLDLFIFPVYWWSFEFCTLCHFSDKPRGFMAQFYMVQQLLGMQMSPYTRTDCVYPTPRWTLHPQL